MRKIKVIEAVLLSVCAIACFGSVVWAKGEHVRQAKNHLKTVEFLEKGKQFRIEIRLQASYLPSDAEVECGQQECKIELPGVQAKAKSYRVPGGGAIHALRILPLKGKTELQVGLRNGTVFRSLEAGKKRLILIFERGEEGGLDISDALYTDNINPKGYKVEDSEEAFFLSYKPMEYRMGVGDVLDIRVYGNNDLNMVATVPDNGTITYPLLGPVEVKNRTVDEIQKHLKENLGRDYLVNPKISVSVSAYHSRWVKVGGSVLSPQKLIIKGPLSLSEAMAEVGGVRLSNLTGAPPAYMTLSRKDEKGQIHKLKLRVTDLSQKGKGLGSLLYLKSGDELNVLAFPDYCYVSGEVKKSGSYPVTDGLTISRLLVLAGGLTEFGSYKKIELRRMESGEMKTFHLNLIRIRKGKEADFTLKPDDMIRVGKRFL